MRRLIGKLIDWFDSHKKISILLVFVCLALILFLRFNRNDIGIIKSFSGLKPGELSPDNHNYMNFTEYFRHKMPLDSVGAPFSFRPLTPYLASLLPYDSFTALNIINLIVLFLSVICIFFILKKYSFSFGFCIAGCLLYILSFPLFYYGAVGNIDSPAIFMTCLIVLATVYKKYLLLPLLLLVAPFTKEGTMVVFPFIMLYVWQTSTTKRERLINGGLVLLSVATFLLGYMYCRLEFSSVSNYLWTPNFRTIYENAVRPKSYLSFILTFGLVGVLAWLEFRLDLKRNSSSKPRNIYLFFKTYSYTPLLVSIITSFLFWIYTFVAAYVDGRYFWFAYPFMIPMAVKYIQIYTESKKISYIRS